MKSNNFYTNIYRASELRMRIRKLYSTNWSNYSYKNQCNFVLLSSYMHMITTELWLIILGTPKTFQNIKFPWERKGSTGIRKMCKHCGVSSRRVASQITKSNNIFIVAQHVTLLRIFNLIGTCQDLNSSPRG